MKLRIDAPFLTSLDPCVYFAHLGNTPHHPYKVGEVAGNVVFRLMTTRQRSQNFKVHRIEGYRQIVPSCARVSFVVNVVSTSRVTYLVVLPPSPRKRKQPARCEYGAGTHQGYSRMVGQPGDLHSAHLSLDLCPFERTVRLSSTIDSSIPVSALPRELSR